MEWKSNHDSVSEMFRHLFNKSHSPIIQVKNWKKSEAIEINQWILNQMFTALENFTQYKWTKIVIVSLQLFETYYVNN
jgi:hypothetical protein